MRRIRGISLITLVITIVIIIILAGVVILNLADKNPIKNSEKARIMEDVSTFASDLALRISKLYADDPGLNMKNIDSSDDEENKYYITKLVSSVEKEKVGSVLYSEILIVRDGKLYFNEDKKDLVSHDEYNAIIEVLGKYSPKNQDKKDDENEGGEEPGDDPSENDPVVPDTQSYTITYKLNDGTDIIYKAQTKTHGEDIIIITDIPTRTGYTFLGWSTNNLSSSGEIKSGSTYTLDENATLYAVWKINTYSLTIKHYLENIDDTNYELNDITTVDNIIYGSTINLVDYKTTIEAGTFEFGSLEESVLGGTKLNTTVIETDLTIYLYYSRNQYTITCIDKIDSISGTTLGSSTCIAKHGETIYGSKFGNSTAIGAYYTDYTYLSCTNIVVDSKDSIVYRIFTYSYAGTITLSPEVSLNSSGGSYIERYEDGTYKLDLTITSSTIPSGCTITYCLNLTPRTKLLC